ncbi:MAG: glucuronate isomerase [Planctomycetes bacterium]|nr:glucuronate isomerase [Planctomycetota bacterium]
MAVFIHDDFLLETDSARELYHNFAKDMPIIDYHCHLSPEEIANNKTYNDISDIWLGGDHYKWRAMRTNGVDEKYCTGDASAREKFDQWAATVPKLLRNPLYHWTHLELSRYFNVTDKLLSPDTADEIWETCNQQVQSAECSSRRLMERSNVRVVCTTDDPIDSLEHHQAIAADDSFTIQVRPTWRPDKVMLTADVAAYNAYVDQLSEVSRVDIGDNYQALLSALRKRHDYFHEHGCRLSDHGLETAYACEYSDIDIQEIFANIRAGNSLDNAQQEKFISALMFECGVMDFEKSWVQQFHLGAMRNNNARLYRDLGPDTGFDSIGDYDMGTSLSGFLSRLDNNAQLSKTILYNLNPRDNEMFATMIGNFQDGSAPGKMQFGSGWWFLDQKDGMERQIESLSQLGLLSRFVGMLTDSRSFLSYTRHEYFRRILCNILGNDIEKGLIPNDMPLVGAMVKDIAYNNAAEYFDFNLETIV